MQGLMMDYQLNVPAILRRADELYRDREIVSRLPDKSWHRYTYADFAARAKRLEMQATAPARRANPPRTLDQSLRARRVRPQRMPRQTKAIPTGLPPRIRLTERMRLTGR